MATPDTATAVETAVDMTRAATVMQHVKENNLAYLVGLLISYQMGILEQAYTYVPTICGC